MIKTALLLSVLAASASAENIRIAVWHTNDVHGWIMPREASWHAENPKRMIGGAAVFARAMAGEADPKLLLDAGDWFQGTPEGTLTRGKAMAEIFNAFNYDAIAPGNHEFDFGQAVVKALVKDMKAPVLCANVYDKKSGKRVDWFKPWIVKEVAGVKVGIFGLLTTKMERLVLRKHLEGLAFKREVDEAKKAVEALKKEGATVIIALSHVGFETPGVGEPFEGDQTLAASVPGIDLIVGGHSHTILRKPVRDAANGTLIVQAGSYLSLGGRALLEIDPATKKVVRSDDALRDLWVDELGEDPAFKAITDRWMNDVGKALEVVVATAATPILHDRKASIESAMGDWMTDCMRDATKADVALQNPGGIRGGMGAGPITLRTLFGIMPFENTIVNLTMTGAQLKEVLEQGASSRGALQVSGMVMTFDPSKPLGQRILSASVGGKELKTGSSYTVSTVDFLVEGGDGFDTFKTVKKKDFTGKLMRDLMEQCARKQGSVAAPPAGRITRKGG